MLGALQGRGWGWVMWRGQGRAVEAPVGGSEVLPDLGVSPPLGWVDVRGRITSHNMGSRRRRSRSQRRSGLKRRPKESPASRVVLVAYRAYLDGELRSEEPPWKHDAAFEDVMPGLNLEVGVVAVAATGLTSVMAKTQDRSPWPEGLPLPEGGA